MEEGRQPASNSLITRWVRTCVLPEPALAETQAELAGSEARDCCTVVQSIHCFGSSPTGSSSVRILLIGLTLSVVIRSGPFRYPGKVVILTAEIAVRKRHQPRGKTGIAAPQFQHELGQLIDRILRQVDCRFWLFLGGGGRTLVVHPLGPEPVAGPQPHIKKIARLLN